MGRTLTTLNISNTAIKRLRLDSTSSSSFRGATGYYYSEALRNIQVENCTELTRIDIDVAQLDTLNLIGAVSLTTIYFDSVIVKSLNLRGCTALEDYCSGNSLATLDLTANTALQSLNCSAQKIIGQRVTSSSNPSYPCSYSFSSLMSDSQLSGIVSGSIHGYTSTGSLIDTTYSGGTALFAYILAEIDYEYATGFGEEVMPVNISVTSGGGGTTTAPVIMNTTLADGVTGISYGAELYASGTKPITWSITSGALPSGLELLPAGIIRDTPTESGTFTFSLTAGNSAGTDTVSYSVTVRTLASSILPTITTSTLDD